METSIFTKTEFEAMRILGISGRLPGYSESNSRHDLPHVAGNMLIELAERIKAERAVAAMK